MPHVRDVRSQMRKYVATTTSQPYDRLAMAYLLETAARLTALGADILKAAFPYDAAVTDETRWTEACAELDAATPVPWVLLSGGVENATFERQVAVAGRAGASGVLVGRSVWAEAATLPVQAREAFLAVPGRDRLAR